MFLDKDENRKLSLESYGKINNRRLFEEESFQKMLERYKIKELWVSGEEKGKEIFKRMEKIVWDAQTSAYAEKQRMTNTEFLRWRLEQLEKETEEEKERRKEEKENMEENF